MTTYLRPASLDEALAARKRHPDFVVLAGGTDLLVSANQKPAPTGIVDVFGLRDLVGVSVGRGGGVRILAATPYASLLRDPLVAAELPALQAAVREIGALQIQSRGTLGGNIATSSPVGDTLPVLLALDATIEIASASKGRQVPYREFCTGYRKTVLQPDELIVAIEFPRLDKSARQVWRKVGPRRAQSISKVMMAAYAEGRSRCRVALGAVSDRPVRVFKTEAAIQNGADEKTLRETLAGEITPIDDVRSTAAYRLRTAQNLVCDFAASLEMGTPRFIPGGPSEIV
jgi:CO/xanthine dehydrogenase FAD-binding subunit